MIIIKHQWTPDLFKEAINQYFLTEEGKTYPTQLGLFDFLNLPDSTRDKWRKDPNRTHIKPLLTLINKADNKIKKFHLKKILINAEGSKWYLERAYAKEFHLTKIEKLLIENINNENQDTNIKIILNNKGKNTIE